MTKAGHLPHLRSELSISQMPSVPEDGCVSFPVTRALCKGLLPVNRPMYEGLLPHEQGHV